MLANPTFARRPQGVLSRIVPDRRRHKRISVTLLGRFMRESKEEHACKLVDISAGGAAIVSPAAVSMGERVVAYFDHIGGIEGIVARTFDGGFAIRINATRHKREKLAAQLTWLANRSELVADGRRHERIDAEERRSHAAAGRGHHAHLPRARRIHLGCVHRHPGAAGDRHRAGARQAARPRRAASPARLRRAIPRHPEPDRDAAPLRLRARAFLRWDVTEI